MGVTYIAFVRQQELVSSLVIVTSGATIGFLFWNKAPAKIYMGDAGALFLGVLLSVLTIRVNPGIIPNWKSLAIPLILLVIPILDTCIAISSRLRRKVSPFQGGRDHLSHRLVRRGLQRKTATMLWALSSMFCLMAILIFQCPAKFRAQLIFAAVIFWAILFSWFWNTPSVD